MFETEVGKYIAYHALGQIEIASDATTAKLVDGTLVVIPQDRVYHFQTWIRECGAKIDTISMHKGGY